MNHKKSSYICVNCTRKIKHNDGKYILCAMHGNMLMRKECNDSVFEVVKFKPVKYDPLGWCNV